MKLERSILSILLLCVWGLSCTPSTNAGGFVGPDGGEEFQTTEHPRKLLQSARIVGGFHAPCGRFPYMASLQTMEGTHVCGGVLIHRQWVLTAAHCVDRESRLWGNMIIFVGHCDLKEMRGLIEDERQVEVFRNDEVVIHEKWNRDRQHGFDIALVKLRNKESVNTPVGYARRHYVLHKTKMVASLGWGVQDDDRYTEQLQYTNDLTILSNNLCDDKQDGWGSVIQDSMICAHGGGNGVALCRGDSGGPLLLVYEPGGRIETGHPEVDTVVGITSFGEGRGCGLAKLPSVHTRVSSYSEWIEGIIEGRPPEHQDAEIPLAPVLPSTNFTSETASRYQEFAITEEPSPTSEQSLSPSPVSPPPDETEPSSTAGPLERTDDEHLQGKGCVCSEDGISRGMSTGLGGCHRRLPKGILECYLASSEGCEISFESVVFPGAAWAPCENDEGVQELPKKSGLSEEEQAKINMELAHVVPLPETSGNEIKNLIMEGADPEFRYQSYPLMVLLGPRGNVTVASGLAEAGADLNSVDDLGETTLHVAASFGHIELVRFLVKAGADTTIRDSQGKTPAAVICSFTSCDGHSLDVLQSLLAKG